MNRASPIVVKLGGSLAICSQLPIMVRTLGRAAGNGLPIVVVPGGGPFADAVRVTQQHCAFDDAAAHDMALLAMAQYGRLLGALATGTVLLAWGAAAVAESLASAPRQAIVWLPEPRSDALEVERSWRIGADALALWLAEEIHARQVILVKSCAQPADQSLPALAAAGIIDPAYPEMALRVPEVATALIFTGNSEALDDALAAFTFA